MWRGIPVPRDRDGDGDELSQAVLPPEYVHGLPPRRGHVRLDSLPLPFERARTDLSSRRLTCVYLATKTENFPISIDAFAGRVKRSPNDVLVLEFLVSQSLRFEYKVHHAHLALQGLIIDMQVRVSPHPSSFSPLQVLISL